MSTKIFLTSGTTWNVPADWDSSNNTIEIIGAGGSGGKTASGANSGGGGGAYAKIINQSLTSSSTVNIQIAAGGSVADTYLQDNSNTTVVKAAAGANGVTGTSGGGAGGLTANCIGTTLFAGGTGGNANGGSGAAGGAGGGAAGSTGAGKNGASANNFGSRPAGGGGGSNGGSSTNGVAPSTTSGASGAAGGAGTSGAGSGAGATVDGTPGVSGTVGGGGGGGKGNSGSDANSGGDGGSDTAFDASHGAGGGGGGGGGNFGSTAVGGNGGLYGGGGGGGNIGSGNGTGGQGIIVITYTALAAGIAFDAAGNSGDQASANTYSGSASWSGTNRMLAVDVSMLGPGVTVSSMTYGGANCTFIGSKSTVTSLGSVESWRICSSDPSAPGTGANTLVVNLSGTLEFTVEWVSYTGVNQTSPTEGFNSAQATNAGSATDASVVITSVADNCWIHAAVVANDTSITANQTSRNNIAGTLGSGANEDNNAAVTPAGTTTMSYTGMGLTTTWAIAGYAIRPLAASGLTVLIRKFLTLLGVG